MERSQSCTSFDATNNSNNDNNQHMLSLNLLPKLEMRQIHLQQQQQQQQPHLEHCGSSDSICISGSSASFSASSASASFSASSSSTTGSSSKPFHFPSLRRKQLRRQLSTTSSGCSNDMSSDMLDPHDDIAYHADLEEEDEDEDEESTQDEAVKNTTAAAATHQKHLHFQQHKQSQSDSMLLATPTTMTGIVHPKDRRLTHAESFDSSGTTADMSPCSQRRQRLSFLMRDNSVQSDSSRYSSVDSLLEARKPDPEAILLNLGFGPVGSEDILSRIPKRFLKPSQVRGIDTEAFVKRLQLASNLADHSVLGYRGLTGNPDAPPSSIVAKIMHRFEVNQRKKSMCSIEQTM